MRPVDIGHRKGVDANRRSSPAENPLESTLVPDVVVARPVNLASVRDLLFNLVRAELTARYKTATFGMLWFLLHPALMTAVLVVVLQGVIKVSIERYDVFLLAALLPWTYFQMGLSNAVSSLTRAPGMMKRVKIPRMLLPIAPILASLVHFTLALVLLLVVLRATGIRPGLTALIMIPFIVALQTVGLIGAGLLTSSLNVLYRDVEHFVAVLLRLGFWLTPIFYPIDYVPQKWRPIALLNPMTGIIEAYRAVLIRHTFPDFTQLALSGILAVLMLLAGIVVFVRLDPQMDDYV